MNPPDSPIDSSGDESIRDSAANWVVRQDRALSPAETAELAAWLDANPRHAWALERARASWKKFHAIGTAVRTMPKAATGARTHWSWATAGLAAAAAVALVWISARHAPERATESADPRSATASAPGKPTVRTFADGSVARLQEGAEIAVAFSPTERRVTLVRGEAFFKVSKDAARPFLVAAGNVTVRAVGTAFIVRSEAQGVDVLVTEGTVQVTPPAAGAAQPGAMVGAGHRAVVAREDAPVVVVRAVSAEEIARALAWNEPMLELGGATLGELVAAFAERSGRRIEISDAALSAARIGGRFPTDDLDGFLRALDQIYEVRAEPRPDGVIVLRKAR